jgi:2-oxoglutarate dehydrogenase E2 component (dihydrolipoamide succinyltransferase)
MIIDMVMPQMGESIVEGTIVKWLKNVGDNVEKDEIILEISTDKVDSEIPSSATGVISELLAKEGDTVEVGTIIARISTDGEAAQADTAPAEPEAVAGAKAEEDIPVASDSTQERPKKFLSPLVKKIAKENNIDFKELDSLDGSGAKGRVNKNDILDYIENQQSSQSVVHQAAAPVPPLARPTYAPVVIQSDDMVEIIPMDHVRKKIADHMVMSKNTAPHVTSVAEVDVTQIVKYRDKVKKSFEQREGVKLTFTAFFVDVVARALKQYPLLNSSLDGDNIIKKKFVNIGIAVGMEKGLIVPVIKNADQLSLVGVAKSVTDVASRARSKQLKPDDVQGGTFSITNIGTFGNIFGTPIINQPQVAILGTGAIKKRPVVVEDDMIAIRSMMYISLTYDHRIIDGLYAGQFLQMIRESLENYDTNK